MESIKAGKLTATVDVNSVAIGEQMIETLFEHEVLGMTVNQFVRVPTDVVDNENVDWHLATLKANLAGSGKY